jgi:cyclopropane fatty-acyl-phospholipid synthase-like methyltransferase
VTQTTDSSDTTAEYYDFYWPQFVRWWSADKTLGIHLGYYEKNTRNHVDAVLNMNEFVARLLGLTTKTSMNIFDAGCGVGGTSIYLAQQYPNCKFTGITLAPYQVRLANQYARERHITNTSFILGNYNRTGFYDECFDGILALESINYTKEKDQFVKEMYRLLKPTGTLVIVDGFLLKNHLDNFSHYIYNLFCKGRGDISLTTPSKLTTILKTTGFTKLQKQNLAQHVQRSSFKATMIGIPYFCSAVIKRIVKREAFQSTRDIDFFMGTSLLSAFLGLTHTTGYYVVTATKE